MSKKHFIALADAIREYNHLAGIERTRPLFSDDHIGLLATFCKWQNHRFNRERWLAYIAGKCGPNGGAL